MLDNILAETARLSWSLRKMRLPIPKGGLVLEVGSGGNPHPASHVLLEKYVDNSHRLRSIRVDRPTVLADACRMPFKDKAFDYVLAFHVLEHVDQPAAFLQELMRVAKAGYIETPNALYERLHPFDVHLLEIADHRGKLFIHKKAGAVHDPYLAKLDWLADHPDLATYFRRRPSAFHVQYFWKDRIDFEVVNPMQSLDWFQPPPPGLAAHATDVVDETPAPRGSWIRANVIGMLRRLAASRSTSFTSLDNLLACPECRGPLAIRPSRYVCAACGVEFCSGPLPDFTAPEACLPSTAN
jgi:SAM-dependent methyltransferase